MCGICGFVVHQPQHRPDRSVLQRMCQTLVHRGPDDEGQILMDSVGLGMRRLSVIDLVTGHQPLSNEDGKIWIVFNGEIYNFLELREELISLGHIFRTKTDTETIVHGYEQWGEDVLKRLNGMFAFALWDEQKKRLLLARDHIGIKPLYWYKDENQLVFGSEIKAILQYPGIHCSVDLKALSRYLTFEYIPSPFSIFKEIRKLEPGSRLILENQSIRIESYWDCEPKPYPWKEKEAVAYLQELFQDAVKRQLISDVPLGAFLSGGIDSSILVSVMAQVSDRPVKTFSIGFKESSYNELPYARAVAQKYHTEHHEEVIEPHALELTERLIRYLDEPFGDFSIFPTFLVSQMARKHVTVILSGDGGDELFAGYDTYKAHRFDQWFYRRLPFFLKSKVLLPLAKKLPPTEKKKGWINSYKRFMYGTMLPESLKHGRWMVFLFPEIRKMLFTEEVFHALENDDPFEAVLQYLNGEGEDVARTGYADVKTYLVDDILVKVDRMSMAVSLEARVPYLDYRMVEFALSLPPEFKMKGFQTKVILKKAFWQDLPKEVQRRGKQGFSIPIKNWIRNELKSMMLDLLSEEKIRREGFFRPEFVSQLVKEHLEGLENHSHLLWALMVFEQWYDLYAKR